MLKFKTKLQIKEFQQLTARLEKTAVGNGMEISLDKKQSRQQHRANTIYQQMVTWKSAGGSGAVQIPGPPKRKTEQQ